MDANFFFFPLLSAVCVYLVLGIILSIYDYRTLQLPDKFTLSLLWLGLFFHSVFFPAMLYLSVYGAITGYLILWILYWLYYLTVKREGLGYGDLKLLAAIGAWNGVLNLPTVLAFASFGGILTFAWLRLTRQPIKRLPFGPYLILAGWGEFVWRWFATALRF